MSVDDENSGTLIDWVDTSDPADIEELEDKEAILEALGYFPTPSAKGTDVQSNIQQNFLIIPLSSDSSTAERVNTIPTTISPELAGPDYTTTEQPSLGRQDNILENRIEARIEEYTRELNELKKASEGIQTELQEIKEEMFSVKDKTTSQPQSNLMNTDLITLGGLEPIDIAVGLGVGFFMLSLYFEMLTFGILGAVMFILTITHDDW